MSREWACVCDGCRQCPGRDPGCTCPCRVGRFPMSGTAFRRHAGRVTVVQVPEKTATGYVQPYSDAPMTLEEEEERAAKVALFGYQDELF